MAGKQHAGPWSAEEDLILKRNYRHHGVAACMRLLPRRTRKAVRVRICKLGLVQRDSEPENYAAIMAAQDRTFRRAFIESGESWPT